MALVCFVIVCLFGHVEARDSPRSFSGLVVFGDSLVDTGNLFALTEGVIPPSPPYFEGRFSNGPVWVELLASQLGLDPQTVINTAFGGATSGPANVNSELAPTAPGLLAQVINFALSSVPTDPAMPDSGRMDPDVLYIAWAGANDFLRGVTDLEAAVRGSVTNIASAIGTLAALGAKTILVPNLPDLGQTPRVLASGDPVAIGGATLLATTFNQSLAETLTALATALDITLIPLDVFTLFTEISEAPSDFNFSNTTERCLSADLTMVCMEPNTFVFWDDIHPTTAAHAVLADFALRKLGEAMNPAYASLK